MNDETVMLPQVKARRRWHGLRLTALPTSPAAVQVLGGVGALAGAYLKFGLGITLLAGGLAVVVLGMLREGGKI